MKVEEILNRKSAGVRTIDPDAKLGEIVGQFESFGVGSLVVVEREKVVGILTERDVVNGYAHHGSSLGGSRVSSLMSRPFTCAPDDDVAQVSSEMTARRQRHAVVLVGSALRGIISIGDVVKCRLDECRLEVAVLRDYARTHTILPAA